MEHGHIEHEEHACERGHHHATNTLTNHEGITVTHHEGAVICSAERVIAKEYGWVRNSLAMELKKLAEWVEEQGGIVGHIKAFLTELGYTSMLSTTGDDVQIKETWKPKVIVNIAIIAFVGNDGDLCAKLVETLEKLNDV